MICYSHVIEDNRIDRHMIQNAKATMATAITGNGERVIALLDTPSLEEIYCIDTNPENQYLLELKLLALKKLSVDDYLHFIGFYQDPVFVQHRLGQFDDFKADLSEEAKRHWDSRIHDIQRGVLVCGSFERFLSRVRPISKIFLASRFKHVLKRPIGECKKNFPFKRFNFWLQVLSLPWVQKFLGSNNISLIALQEKKSGLFSALSTILNKGESVTSFLFHLAFVGDFRYLPKEQIPPSLKREILTKVKHQLQHNKVKIHYKLGGTCEVLSGITSSNQSSFHSFLNFEGVSDLDPIKKTLKTLKEKFSNPCVVVRYLPSTKNCHELSQFIESENIGKMKDCSEEEMTRIYSVYVL
ncbi:MAG: DUF3419 family protein [Oligoflexia bacterium]|nr:DUF3419 family protein [Oligoflexia bacterium]MBF0364428.1 DUF3419 family protein [Oligoflexia bacterium]